MVYSHLTLCLCFFTLFLYLPSDSLIHNFLRQMFCFHNLIFSLHIKISCVKNRKLFRYFLCNLNP
uniref:Uncharacterized protein n=1 Tax=Octopus bimaculoides TaxID=37653 RepID=A0A0L8FPN0_OCTBM